MMKNSPQHILSSFAALLTCNLIFSLNAHAQTVAIFNGSVDNTWENGSNWDILVPPTTSQRTRFNADAVLQSSGFVRSLEDTSGGQTLTIANGGNLLSQGNATGAWGGGFSLVVEDGGTFRRNTLGGSARWDMRNTGAAATVTVNNGGTFSVNQNARIGNGNLIVDGSNANMSFVNLFTPDLTVAPAGNTDTFGATSSTISLLNGGNLTVTGRMRWDGAATVTVGNGSTLNLGAGGAGHIFSDGLTIETDGTLGMLSNAPVLTTIDNTGGAADFTLQDGATINYSIRGTDNASDTLLFLSNLDSDFGAAPTTLNLLVDVIAGDVKQSAGPFKILDFGSALPTGWDSIAWNISAGEGTRLSSTGSVIVGDGSNGLEVGEIGLSGFEAFSIPEPSTGMLFGIGGLVMVLRRRIIRR